MKTLAFLVARERGTSAVLKHCGSEMVDARMDTSKADGVAS